ncbi:DUF4129 domain-containing protein [Sphingomonas sp.]
MTTAAAPPPDPAAIDAAWKKVRADGSIQFDFPWRKVEAEPDPQWIEALARAIERFFRALGPLWEILFYLTLALIALVLFLAFYPPARDAILAFFRRRPAVEAPPRWQPDRSGARALLAEAEQLAAQGDYGEAVHLLLLRSIEDIERWRGRTLGVALTARDIAGVEALPDAARPVFARLVAMVERALFARRAISADEWNDARDAYRRFAL